MTNATEDLIAPRNEQHVSIPLLPCRAARTLPGNLGHFGQKSMRCEHAHGPERHEEAQRLLLCRPILFEVFPAIRHALVTVLVQRHKRSGGIPREEVQPDTPFHGHTDNVLAEVQQRSPPCPYRGLRTNANSLSYGILYVSRVQDGQVTPWARPLNPCHNTGILIVQRHQNASIPAVLPNLGL